MKSRPTIFLSGVSDEFATFRDAVQTEILTKGCYPENQPGFAPDYNIVEEMLRRRLHDSDAVIHIAGFRFGAEPHERPAGKPRRSYTQLEFDIAREMQKPVYIFLSKDASVRDAAMAAEDAEAATLQLSHRTAITTTNYFYRFFNDKAELCKLVAEIPIVAAASFKADISRIVKYAPADLIGREPETKLLNDAWLQVRRAESPRPHVITFVALGGEGKTSLVAKWAAELAHQDWPGCDAVFAWSFYSQGTREQVAASSDLFLREALIFFGDAAMADSAQGAYERGRRLAQLAGERRTLLILDGLEPLQYAPTSPMPGELKDQGIAVLLKGLAASSHSLCVVTTRYSIPDLRAYWQTTAPEEKLPRLSREAGAHLLLSLGVKGSLLRNISFNDGHEQMNEFEALVEEVKGHALTLNLLGTYLRDAHGGDIRKRDLVSFKDADAANEHQQHAFRVMDAYVRWMSPRGIRAWFRRLINSKEREAQSEGKRALRLLTLVGFFDRPATAGCLEALWKAPVIENLTEPLVGLSEAQRNRALKRLEDAKLLTVNGDAANQLVSLDSHPLIREYFAVRLKAKHRKAWQAGHKRLYEYLCASTKEGDLPTLEDLEPLYQAVAHGCQARMQAETFADVYLARLLKREAHYSWRKLGAYGSDLGAVVWFFEKPWNTVSPLLTEEMQFFVMAQAALYLRDLGRLTDSLDPMRAGLEMSVKQEIWKGASRIASNLSELEMMLGDVTRSLGDAEQSVAYANRGGDIHRVGARTAVANALHQAGREDEALVCFREAEKLQVEFQSAYPLLYSQRGFQYCDLLLAATERGAWVGSQKQEEKLQRDQFVETCRAVCKRAEQTLKWVTHSKLDPFSIALDHLTLGRASLYEVVLSSESPSLFTLPASHLSEAVSGLRRAGAVSRLPDALLTRAWCSAAEASEHRLYGREKEALECWNSSQADLDEAWEIASRGPMPLFMADIHLYRARLFGRMQGEGGGMKYPGESPEHDLREARRLIEKHGYWRRKEELEDAEANLLSADCADWVSGFL